MKNETNISSSLFDNFIKKITIMNEENCNLLNDNVNLEYENGWHVNFKPFHILSEKQCTLKMSCLWARESDSLQTRLEEKLSELINRYDKKITYCNFKWTRNNPDRCSCEWILNYR